MPQTKKTALDKAIRIDSNLYHFVKEHNLELCFTNNFKGVSNVIFPKDCISTTLIIIGGKIEHMGLCPSYNSGFYTYDASHDPCYEENFNKLLTE